VGLGHDGAENRSEFLLLFGLLRQDVGELLVERLRWFRFALGAWGIIIVVCGLGGSGLLWMCGMRFGWFRFALGGVGYCCSMRFGWFMFALRVWGIGVVCGFGCGL
jgi:hypothetical protein